MTDFLYLQTCLHNGSFWCVLISLQWNVASPDFLGLELDGAMRSSLMHMRSAQGEWGEECPFFQPACSLLSKVWRRKSRLFNHHHQNEQIIMWFFNYHLFLSTSNINKSFPNKNKNKNNCRYSYPYHCSQNQTKMQQLLFWKYSSFKNLQNIENFRKKCIVVVSGLFANFHTYTQYILYKQYGLHNIFIIYT